MAKGLGTGLGALFGEDLLNEEENSLSLPVAKLEPRAGQPRTTFDEEALAELAESFREHGMIQPIVVRKIDGGYYQIIAGERRWRAARLAGLTEVPVRVLDADDKKTAELALIENLQREDLNPMEEARGYRQLMDTYQMTQEQVSERVGKSRPVVANALRLLNLPEDVIELVEKQELTLSHARALLELERPSLQSELAKRIVKEDLSVREVTRRVKELKNAGERRPKPDRRAVDGVDYLTEIEGELTRTLGRRVHISPGFKKGRFELEYYDPDDFEALYHALQKLTPAGGSEK